MAKRDRDRTKKLFRLGVLALTGAAIAQELKKPPEDRTWNGTVGGFIPYDFRIPTPERVRARLWDPEGDVISPQVFGVGWSVNIGRVVAAFRDSRA